MTDSPSENLPGTDLPATVPLPPLEASRWAADRLGESGWESLSGIAGPKGGQPARWLALPCRVYERWQAGVYRIHWQTNGRRALGTSEPFRSAPGDPQREDAPQTPMVDQKTIPIPETARTWQGPPELAEVANQIVAQIKTAKTPKAPVLEQSAATFLAIEERSHKRQVSILEHHTQIANSLTEAFKLYLGRVDQRDRVHQEQIDHLRNDAAEQIRAIATQAQERESTLAQELETTRSQMTEQGEQIAELAAEPERTEPDPETFQQKIAAVLQMLSTPEAQQVIGLVRAAVAQQQPAAAGLPSPAEASGGSVGE
jgi:hypothetical protein